MQDFEIPEGKFSLPTNFVDRTTYVYLQPSADRQKINMNLSINRESLTTPMTLVDYLEKQVQLMQKNLKKFTILHKVDCHLMAGKYAGIMLESKFLSAQQWIFQRQAAFLYSQQQILIFSLSAEALTAEHHQIWDDCISSFRDVSCDTST